MGVDVSNQKKNRAHVTCDLQLANLLLHSPPASPSLWIALRETTDTSFHFYLIMDLLETGKQAIK